MEADVVWVFGVETDVVWVLGVVVEVCVLWV